MKQKILEDAEAKNFFVTTELRADGWYYTNIGYRWHGEVVDGKFLTIWDIEEYVK